MKSGLRIILLFSLPQIMARRVREIAGELVDRPGACANANGPRTRGVFGCLELPVGRAGFRWVKIARPIIGSDLFSTILGIVDIPLPKDRTIDGTDFHARLFRQAPNAPRFPCIGAIIWHLLKFISPCVTVTGKFWAVLILRSSSFTTLKRTGRKRTTLPRRSQRNYSK